MVEHKEMMYLDYNFLGSADRLTFDKELSATEFFNRWGLDEGQICQLHRTEDDRLVIVYTDFLEEYPSINDEQWHENQLDLF